MKSNTEQNKIIKELAYKHNLPEEKVKEIIKSPFVFIRNTIKSINFENVKTEEEFNNKVKNFNIPHIGKLYGSFFNFKRIKKDE